MKISINFKKTSENSIVPVWDATGNCLNCFANIKKEQQRVHYVGDPWEHRESPDETHVNTYKIPLGFSIDIPEGWEARTQGLVGLQLHGIGNMERVFNSNFKDELYAIIYNIGGADHFVKPGDLICQISFHQTNEVELIES